MTSDGCDVNTRRSPRTTAHVTLVAQVSIRGVGGNVSLSLYVLSKLVFDRLVRKDN